jgi:cytochrome c oxidase cbb3-type subunit 3
MDKMPKSLISTNETEELLAAVGVDLGKENFTAKCVACHGQKGEGLIGPNLTDKYWLHGNGTRKDILVVIRAGVPEKGMPSWGALLKAEEQLSIAAYIYSLRNSNPANAKAPQGVEIK